MTIILSIIMMKIKITKMYAELHLKKQLLFLVVQLST